MHYYDARKGMGNFPAEYWHQLMEAELTADLVRVANESAGQSGIVTKGTVSN